MNESVETGAAEVQRGAESLEPDFGDTLIIRESDLLSSSALEVAKSTNDMVQRGLLPGFIIDQLADTDKMMKAGVIAGGGFLGLGWSDAAIDRGDMGLMAGGIRWSGQGQIDDDAKLAASMALSMMDKGILPQTTSPWEIQELLEPVSAVNAARNVLDAFKDGGWEIAAKGDEQLQWYEVTQALENPEGLTEQQVAALRQLEPHLDRLDEIGGPRQYVTRDGLQKNIDSMPEAVARQQRLEEMASQNLEKARAEARTEERMEQLSAVDPAAASRLQADGVEDATIASALGGEDPYSEHVPPEPLGNSTSPTYEELVGLEPAEAPAAAEAAIAEPVEAAARERDLQILELLSQDTQVGRGEGFWHSASRLLDTTGGDDHKGLTRLIKNYHEETSGLDFDNGAYLRQNQQLIDETLFAQIKEQYPAVYERYAQAFDAR